MSDAKATDDQVKRATNSRDAWIEQSQKNGNKEASDNGWLKATGRIVGKGLYMGSAADVIVKDGRRMRPLYPEIWRTLFSKRGLKTAKERFFSNEMRTEKGFPWSALTGVVSGLVLALIIVAGVVSGYFPNQMPWVNRLGIAAVFFMGAVMTVCYSAVLVILIQRRYWSRAKEDVKRDSDNSTGGGT